MKRELRIRLTDEQWAVLEYTLGHLAALYIIEGIERRRAERVAASKVEG